MKLLCTADLHFRRVNSHTLNELRKAVSHNSPDVVVVAGDIYDNRKINPYEEFATLGCPVIFCLGNHEFVYRTVEQTLEEYRNYPTTADVYCLDIDDYVDIDGVRFVGNVLWYDGSCSIREDRDYKVKHIDDGWLDRHIVDFDALAEHDKCVEQIVRAMDGYVGKSVLVTHTVPHWVLNMFNYDNEYSPYNVYSGVWDLFKKTGLHFDVAVCGHTHREKDLEYQFSDDKWIRCYNIGNDYEEYDKFLKYKIINV